MRLVRTEELMLASRQVGSRAYSDKEAVDRWNAERKSDTKKGNKQ